jgi:hypothetical protein
VKSGKQIIGVIGAYQSRSLRQNAALRAPYWMELATEEKALLAFEPMSRTVPTTSTRMTASITAYSAISCPFSSVRSLRNNAIMLHQLASLGAETMKKLKRVGDSLSADRK